MKTYGWLMLMSTAILAVSTGVYAAVASAEAAQRFHVNSKGTRLFTPPASGRHGFPFVSSAADLSSYGFREEEYFVSGTAARYRADDMSADGRWRAERTSDQRPFTVRVLIRRPVQPARFNGTVLVEWMNVTGLADGPADWWQGFEEIVRNGYVWVGVSAQYLGVDGAPSSLKAWDDQRYAALQHPGDSFSYDIFTQAAAAVLANASPAPLADLKLRNVIATGESQAGTRLTTYYNAVQPMTGLFDGFLIHSRSATAAQLSQATLADVVLVVKDPQPLPELPAPRNTPFRNDLRTPLLNVTTETDLIVADYFHARQPDSAYIRSWEIAGSAHADAHLMAMEEPDGQKSCAPKGCYVPGCDKPINRSDSHHLAFKAALRSLKQWVETREPPPSAPRLEIEPGTPPTIRTDANGISKGGIRTPDVDAPLAVVNGKPNTPAFCSHFGNTVALDPVRLRSLYPSKQQYLNALEQAVRTSVSAGHVLPEDAAPLLDRAAQLPWPPTSEVDLREASTP